MQKHFATKDKTVRKELAKVTACSEGNDHTLLNYCKFLITPFVKQYLSNLS